MEERYENGLLKIELSFILPIPNNANLGTK